MSRVSEVAGQECTRYLFLAKHLSQQRRTSVAHSHFKTSGK